jgi:hypothetical protein
MLVKVAFPALILGIILITAVLMRKAPTHLGSPRHAAVATKLNPPTLSAIGDFATIIDTVPDNPFMYNGKPISDPSVKPPSDPTGDPGNSVPPPSAPPRHLPTLVLPAAAPLFADAPVCHGLLTIGATRFALVTITGHPDLRQMEVGDTISATTTDHPWTLIGLEAGNLARWRGPTGSEEIFPIADGVHATLADHADARGSRND